LAARKVKTQKMLSGHDQCVFVCVFSFFLFLFCGGEFLPLGNQKKQAAQIIEWGVFSLKRSWVKVKLV
jgi:hypothetical protein